MDDAIFRGDCGRCAGLCCVALSFERGPLFAFDKPSAQSCRHLGPDYRCVIHDRLAAEGMAGCARYDCLGAGQLVTAMFAGLDSPAAARARLDAFSRVRDIQLLRKVVGSADTDLASRLETATRSYPALLSLDLLAARRAAGAIVRRRGRAA